MSSRLREMAEDSPLSSPMSSGYASEDIEQPRAARATQPTSRNGTTATQPPSKRLKLSTADDLNTPPSPDPTADAEDAPLSPISSDTSGEVPSSPNLRGEEEEPTQEQVTVCCWDGCSAGDLGNMDLLVDHIHNQHVEWRPTAEGRSDVRQKKYTCEWEDCSRKGMAHASAYALKAHMRSHTREKPFYCVVPECDRAFTRSDALQKHMRTVHETEALRPSDPVPKAGKGGSASTSLKLVLKASPHSTDTTAPDAQLDADGLTPFPTELQFTPEELKLSPHDMWRLLRRQVHWAEEEADQLKRETEMVEAIRRKAWMEKEVLLGQVIKSELDWHDRRQVVLAAESARLAAIAEAQKNDEEAEIEQEGDEGERVGETENGEEPKVAESVVTIVDGDIDIDIGAKDDQEEAAAVLASLHNA